jgi:ATP-dependent Clp protease ATP-binding subunit ClpC
MFERYTEKARRVIFFARDEAYAIGSTYIETEFLLLGILAEDKSVIVRWLSEGDWQRIFREEVAKGFFKVPKLDTSGERKLSNEAKRVLFFAAEEAELLGHHHIGTEHLFLGLLREPESRVAKLLSDRGVNLGTVRETIATEGVQTQHPGEDE